MADEVPLTPDRVALMAELARLSFEASQIAMPLDDIRFNWRPDVTGAADHPEGAPPAKGWSVGQCLEHIVRLNRVFLDVLEDAARLELRNQGKCEPTPLSPGRVGKWFLSTVEPPATTKYESPKKTLPPEHCSKEQTLIAFAGEQQRIIEFVRDTACIDCNTIKIKNPLSYGMRVFSLSTGILLMPAHERRHLLQARNVLARMPK